MNQLLAWLESAEDPVAGAITTALATYGGLAALVTFLVSGVKALWKGWVAGKEGYLTIALSYLLGAGAKLATDFYGPNSVKSWSLHLLILAFVAVGSAAFHDRFVNILQGKKGKPS